MFLAISTPCSSAECTAQDAVLVTALLADYPHKRTAQATHGLVQVAGGTSMRPARE